MKNIFYWDIDLSRIHFVRNELENFFNLEITATLNELSSRLRKEKIDALMIGMEEHPADSVLSFIGNAGRNAEYPVFVLFEGARPPYSPDRGLYGGLPAGMIPVHRSQIPELRMIILARFGLESQEINQDPPIFVGKSAAIREVTATIRRYAATKYPVLVVGETGTGKELAANALHSSSPRKNGPIVALNCSAIPENLVESELFGTVRGAFTDAVAHQGAFARAAKGTLFLDEVGSMTLAVQPKLLRALETGSFWKLGAENSESSDFRLVCATCLDIFARADENLFRKDLLYRISDLVVMIPPLRERKEDIPLLVEHFCRQSAGGLCEVSSAAIEKLEGHDWQGNVRELRSVINRACANVQAGTIRAEDILFISCYAGTDAPRPHSLS